MSIITVTATLIPATGLTQVATYRDGECAHVKWIDIHPWDTRGDVFAVLAAMRDATGGRPNTLVRSDARQGFYSLTARVA